MQIKFFSSIEKVILSLPSCNWLAAFWKLSWLYQAQILQQHLKLIMPYPAQIIQQNLETDLSLSRSNLSANPSEGFETDIALPSWNPLAALWIWFCPTQLKSFNSILKLTMPYRAQILQHNFETDLALSSSNHSATFWNWYSPTQLKSFSFHFETDLLISNLMLSTVFCIF